ncbi:Glycerophosphoryl diester phosphodiesterase precursor [Corynebacterium ciconiae DSM 44920]|uniref:glycerophosphodiester phosphodiesterase family protein n=1 Tax=Corynebacterium ciconiae TaxID=227319 RepID=UPI000380F4B1|nr:glycerophosphodiester phosphodiesterase family protein [Corynebacterium ciconiae]WKD60175.1 Glycerophosphoryl diester phosphodiesterase precursor [Corynebacterium ciconiae DSM 44920]
MTLRRSLCALAVGSLVLAGCSDGSNDDASSETRSDASESVTVDASALDVQAHRGGRGEHTEESLVAFSHALDLGVDTLELDIVMSADGVPMVWHDPRIEDDKCADTEPATEGDEQYPYVGKLVHELTYEQLETLRCDKTLEDFPDATPAEDNRIAQLSEVFDLAKEKNPEVAFNIETKIEAENPEESAPPREFVDAILAAADEAGLREKITIQSFDWSSLEIVQEIAPEVPTVALYDETTWTENSPWLGSVSYADAEGDVLTAVQQLGATVVSPGYAVPYGAKAGEDDYHPVATADYVARAHKLGLTVIPWTVNDEATMRDQIEAGVDGLITDYPALLVKVAQDYGWEPKA